MNYSLKDLAKVTALAIAFGVGVVCVAFIYAFLVSEKPQTKQIVNEYNVQVFTDSKTGCEYLIWDDYKKGTMTPRLDKDGKIICTR